MRERRARERWVASSTAWHNRPMASRPSVNTQHILRQSSRRTETSDVSRTRACLPLAFSVFAARYGSTSAQRQLASASHTSHEVRQATITEGRERGGGVTRPSPLCSPFPSFSDLLPSPSPVDVLFDHRCRPSSNS